MLVLSTLTFFTQFAHPFHETFAARDTTDQETHANIYVMDADGIAQTRLTISTKRGGWGAAWSPDSRKIAFTSAPENDPHSSAGQIFLMNADGKDWTQLTHNGRMNYLPSWSPNGRKIAFISQTSTRLNTADIFVVQEDGGQETQLTDNDVQEYGISWAPDGKQIVFGSLRDGTWQLYKMDADGSNQTLLTASGGGNAPAWSPDGTKIAFTSDRYGNDDIFVMDSDGGHLLRLTDNNAHDDNPAWSPDSSKLVFSSNRDGNENIFVMNADGSNATNLSQDSTMWNGVPEWSPDGKKILYTTQGNPSRPSGFVQSLGIASVLIQAALLMGVVLLALKHLSLPFGAMTVIIGVNGALMTVFHDRYVLLPVALLTGIIADLLLWLLHPSETRRLQFALFAFIVPVVFYSLYYLTLQLTQGIAWSIHLWLGSIFLAGITGLFVSFLLVSSLRTARETVH
jgi:dipeptidyl aminopeptidase/acylaminoacyl peptidase